jgi:SAM-dependent methyltransferase
LVAASAALCNLWIDRFSFGCGSATLSNLWINPLRFCATTALYNRWTEEPSMQLLERWLSELSPTQRILDLGCGSGSLRAQLAGHNVFGADLDAGELARSRDLRGVCAWSNSLPFASQSFRFVICHHSMEHFADAEGAIREIRRVLEPGGRLFVTIPEGVSFSDRLYRFLFCGGDHFQRFTFESLVAAVESGADLHLAGWKELSTSFTWMEKRSFVPAPIGRLPGPLPRRMRRLGLLPAWLLDAARILLNVGSRLADRLFSTSLSRYGWAFAFGPDVVTPQEEPGTLNVCMACGSGIDGASAVRVGLLLYRCPDCARLNVFFGDGNHQL